MALLKNRWTLNFDLPGVLFWCFISLIFPLAYGTLGPASLVKTGLFLVCSVCAGEVVLGSLPFMGRIPTLLRTGALMMMGTYILFFVFALLPYPILFYVLSGGMVALFVVKGRVSRTFDPRGLAAVIPICILLFYTTDLRLASSPTFVDVPGDYFFYNVLVISLSKNLSIYNALFHTGIPMNYQSLTFFSPGALSFATGISPHVALHGVFSPMMKVLSFSMLGASIVQVCRWVKGEEAAPAYSWKYYAAASTALLLLAPLHPLYLAKLDIKNTIFLGEGYLLPLGVMGFAFAVFLFGLLNFFFFSNEKKNFWEIGFFVVVLSSIAAIKTAMFFPLVAFLGLYSIISWIRDRKDRRILYVSLGLIGGVLIMQIFFGNAGGMIRNSLTMHEGYFTTLFSRAIEKFHRVPTVLNLFLFFSFTFILWMGLKTVLFSGVLFSRQGYLSGVWPMIVAALGAALISLLPGFFIKISMVDEKGVLLQDGTFDMGQFSRAGLFICTTVAVVCLFLLWGMQTGIKRRLLQAVVFVWFGVALLSFFMLLREAPGQSYADGKWESEVEADFQRDQPKLMGMISNFYYSGQSLMTKGVYPWWTCSKRGADLGYVCTLRSNYRNVLLENLLSDTVGKKEKLGIVRQMQKEGVDALVATPVNKEKFNKLEADSILYQPKNSKWIYKIANTSNL